MQASDFDGPLEIRLSTDAKFSRARITGRSPIDLEVDLIVEPQKISFKPTLLNPHDKLVISAITSGATPTLSAKVRVAGVESAPIQKSIRDKSTIPRWLAIPAFFWSAFLLMVALKAMDTFAIGERSDKRRRLTVAAVMIAALPPALAFQFFAV